LVHRLPPFALIVAPFKENNTNQWLKGETSTISRVKINRQIQVCRLVYSIIHRCTLQLISVKHNRNEVIFDGDRRKSGSGEDVGKFIPFLFEYTGVFKGSIALLGVVFG